MVSRAGERLDIIALTGDEWIGHRMSELDPECALPVLEVMRQAVRAKRCGSANPSWTVFTSRP
jgi:hypothetical protein